MTPTDTPKADQPEPGEAAMEAATRVSVCSSEDGPEAIAAIIQRAINAAVKPVEAERARWQETAGLKHAKLVLAEQERDAARVALAALLPVAEVFERQASKGSGGRRGGKVFEQARAALLAEPDLSKGEGGG